MRRSVFLTVIVAACAPYAARSQPIDSLEWVDAQIAAGNYTEAERRLGDMYGQTHRVGAASERNRLALRYAELKLTFGLFNEAAELSRNSSSEPRDIAVAGWITGRVQYARGRYSQAMADYNKALNSARSGDAQLIEGRILIGIGDVQRTLGDLPAAEQSLTRALATLQAIRAPSHELAEALSALGDVQSAREDFPAARKSYSDVVALFSSRRPIQQPAQARALLGMLELAYNEGNLEEARKYWAAGIKLVSSLEYHPVYSALEEYEHLIALDTSGFKVKEARYIVTQTQHARKSLLGEDHPDVARTYETLAALFVAEENRKTAIQQLEAAIRIYSAQIGDGSLQVARSLTRMGLLQAQDGAVATAEASLTRAVEIRRKTLGDKSVAVAESNLALCSVFLNAGNSTRAEPLCRSSRTALQNRLTVGDVRIQSSVRLLGIALSHQRTAAVEAQQLLGSWLATQERAPRRDARAVSSAKAALARVYAATNKYAEAQQTYDSLLAADLATIDRTAVLMGLADVQFKQQKYRESSLTLEAAVKTSPSADTADTNRMLGYSYVQQKQYARAAPVYRKAIAAYDKAGATAQPQANAVSLELAEALIETGATAEAEAAMNRWLSGVSGSGVRPINAEIAVFQRVMDRLVGFRRYSVAEAHLRVIMTALVERKETGSELGEVLSRLAIVTAALNKPHEAAGFYLRVAEIDRNSHNVDSAHRHITAALTVLEKSGSVKDERFVAVLNQFARSYLDQRKYVEADTQFRRSRDIIASLPKTDPVQLAICLNGLGRVAQATKQDDAAAALYDQAEDLIRNSANAPPSLIAELTYNRGALAFNANKLDEADNLYQKAFDIALGAGYALEPDQIEGMVELYLRQQRYAEAEKLYVRLLEMRKDRYGAGSAEFGWAQHAAADFYLNQKDLAKAAEYGSLALSTFENVGGRESDEVQAALGTLANVYRAQGKLENSVELQTRRLAVVEKNNAPEATQQIVLNDLAESYNLLKEWGKAAQIYDRVLKLLNSKGARNPNYLTANMRLIDASLKLKEYERAHTRFTQLRRDVKGQPEENFILQAYSKALAASGYMKESQKIAREVRKN